MSAPDTTKNEPSAEDIDALLGDFPDITTDIVKRAELFADLTRVPTRPTLTILVHLASDVLMLGGSTALAVLVWSQFTTKTLDPSLYWIFAIAIFVDRKSVV